MSDLATFLRDLGVLVFFIGSCAALVVVIAA